MKAYFLVLLLAIISVTYGDSIKCYTCPRTTEQCELSDATPIKCGQNGICITQTRKDATDKKLAIRKCVVPDIKTKKVNCPDGWDCIECNTDECNSANSVNFKLTFGIIATITTVLITKFVL